MTLSALGIFSAAGAGVVDLGSYDLLETQVLASAQSSILFSSLSTYSPTYKHLQIRATVRSVRAAADDQLTLRISGDSAGNYAWHRLLGDGSTVSSTGATSLATPQVAAVPANTATASMFAGLVIDVLDPYSTTKNKTVKSLNGFAGNWIALHSVLHMSTSAVSSIELIGQNGNLATGTRVSLYGIKG
jgi:hypothetical protein